MKSFLKTHRAALIVLLFLFLIRLMAFESLGKSYNIDSDDLSYLKSGITFLRTGMITMHEPYPSAQIMPGLTLLIALFYKICGDREVLWIVLKITWFLMGTLTGWLIYRSVRLFAPKWCGIAAMLCLFRADFIWMDNLVLSETPFFLALTAMIYFTLRMGKYGEWRDFWGCLIAYMAGLLLKANIGAYPLFALLYLLCKKYDLKRLLKQCVIVLCAVLCLIVPWSMRNARQFHAFIPLTYGAGNPSLLGTYQGQGYPSDKELDYKTNVDAVVEEKYAICYAKDGSVLPEYERYISLRKDEVKAQYRRKVWAQQDLQSYLFSYLFLKPQILINGIFYWESVLSEDGGIIILLQRFDLYFCMFTIMAAMVLKKMRLPVLFLSLTYLGHVYIYALTYAFGRYNASLMCMRFILFGIGLSLLPPLVEKVIQESHRPLI